MRVDLQVPWEMERRIRALKDTQSPDVEYKHLFEYLVWRGLHAIQEGK